MNPWEKKKWAVVLGIVLLCVGGSLYFTVPQKLEEPEQMKVVHQLQEKGSSLRRSCISAGP